MKIEKELLRLTREHHTALSLGNQCVNAAKMGDEKRIKHLCEKISTHFKRDYAAHFETEEKTIFAFLSIKSDALALLCEQLTLEHRQLYTMADVLDKNSDALEHFGTLLKSHVRLENRQLFPKVALLSSSQRQAIFDASNNSSSVSPHE